jgi:pimeloyl-ACP methyl ester carboxylesterase
MLVSLTLSVGHPACAQTESIDPELLKPHLVAVERGRRLQIACAGDGSPTIVFEQGAEGSIVDWRKVQAKASAISRTCFYDRAGFGLSDPPSDGVDGIHVTDDLRRLLLAADIRGPVVLVGNSIGGFYATLFADRFPQQVAGIVLVNSNFAGQFAPGNARQRKRELQNLAKAGQRLKTCAELAKQGALSAQTPQGCFSVAPDLTAAEANYLLRGRTRPSWYEAEIEQSNSFFPSGPEADSLSWRQERLAHREFGDLPVVVLSSESPPGEPIQNVKSPAEESQRWKDGQRKLAARSTRGEWREVPGSTQLMLSDQPQRIIEAIQKVVAEARASIAVTNKAGKPIKAAKGGRAAKRTR